jgi:hypothetical protein
MPGLRKAGGKVAESDGPEPWDALGVAEPLLEVDRRHDVLAAVIGARQQPGWDPSAARIGPDSSRGRRGAAGEFRPVFTANQPTGRVAWHRPGR